MVSQVGLSLSLSRKKKGTKKKGKGESYKIEIYMNATRVKKTLKDQVGLVDRRRENIKDLLDKPQPQVV